MPAPFERKAARPALHLASALLLLVSGTGGRAEGLTALWDAARGEGEYQAPGAEELREAEELFRRTLQGKEEAEPLNRAWGKLHWELAAVTGEREPFLVLREQPGHRTGRGFFLFRRGPAPALALEAPHGTDDLYTGKIALSLFDLGEVKAGAWSTVRRAQADPAHLPAGYFQAFTRAFAETHRRGLVIQLHGFEASKRSSEAGIDADLIVSNGTRRPPRWLLAAAQALRDDLTGRVKVYPNDIRELGGTTNAQAQLLQDLGHDGFLHAEMSLALRKRLRDEREAQQVFLKCLTGIYRKERE
jgi:hypothetical protein